MANLRFSICAREKPLVSGCICETRWDFSISHFVVHVSHRLCRYKCKLVPMSELLSVCVSSFTVQSVSVSSGSASTPAAGHRGSGRRAPHWAQMAPTDTSRDDHINTLINNYRNNDTLDTTAATRRTAGRWETRTDGAESKTKPKVLLRVLLNIYEV